MAKVFISYSRKDIEFAKKLTGELKKSSLDFWVDWEGIPPTVDWLAQIEKGIEESDTFVFILSPDSIKSKVCKQEIEMAVKNGKRLVPIVARDVKSDLAPSELSHLNWIFFRKADDFQEAIKKLLTAINTDYEWVQIQRRLQVKALEWERSKQEGSFLLRGKDLQDAELQLATNSAKQPHPTSLQREYVLRSRQAADRSRRITAIISAIGIIALTALSIASLFWANESNQNRIEAEANLVKAQQAEAKALDEKEKAQRAMLEAEEEARNARSGRLLLEQQGALKDFPQRALLIALEAIHLREEAKEPIEPAAEEALRLALEGTPGMGLPGFNNEVSLIQFTKDNKWLVAGSTVVEGEGQIKFWNFESLMSDPAYQPDSISLPISYFDNETGFSSEGIYLSPNTTWLVATRQNETKLWKIDAEGTNREPLVFEGEVEFTDPKSDYTILEKQENKTTLWKINPEDLSQESDPTSFTGSLITFSPDKTLLVTDDPEKGLLLWNFYAPSTPPVQLTSDHASSYQLMIIDPANRWLILFQDVPRENIQIPITDSFGNPAGTEAWLSTDVVLIPLDQKSAPPQYRVTLNQALDTSMIPPKFSPNGNTLVFLGSSSPDFYGKTNQSITAFKFIEGQFNYQYSVKPDKSIYSLDFPSNDWLYVESYDYMTGLYNYTMLDLRLENLYSGTEIPVSLARDSNGELAFSEDGKWLLTTSGEMIDFEQLEFNQAVLMSPAPITTTENGPADLVRVLENNPESLGLEDSFTASALSPDGLWFAAGARDGSVRIWNNKEPHQSSSIKLAEYANYFAFSNDNNWMAAGKNLWHLKDGIPEWSVTLESEFSPNVAVFSPDGRWLTYVLDMGTYSEDGTYNAAVRVKLVDVTQVTEKSGVTPIIISDKETMYYRIQFSADSRWIVFKDAYFLDRMPALIYDTQNKKSYPLPYPSLDVDFTSDIKHVVLTEGEYNYDDGSYHYHNPEIWALPQTANGDLKLVKDLEQPHPSIVSPNGRWLLSTPQPQINPGTQLYDTTVTGSLWDLNCVIEKNDCQPVELPVFQAGFTPNSNRLITGYSETNEVESPLVFDVWDVSSTPNKIFSSQTPNFVPSISQSGNLIVFRSLTYDTASAAGSFSSWSGYTFLGSSVTTFDGYGKFSYPAGAEFSNASGFPQTDYDVEAYQITNDGQTGEAYFLRGHESNISSSQISPNERYVLTYTGANRDNGGVAEHLLRLWDTQRELAHSETQITPVVLPLAPDTDIALLAFSPDSRWVYVIDSQNTLHYFPTALDDLKEQACIAVGRNFSLSEWERFFTDVETKKTLDYRKTCANLPEHPSAVNP